MDGVATAGEKLCDGIGRGRAEVMVIEVGRHRGQIGTAHIQRPMCVAQDQHQANETGHERVGIVRFERHDSTAGHEQTRRPNHQCIASRWKQCLERYSVRIGEGCHRDEVERQPPGLGAAQISHPESSALADRQQYERSAPTCRSQARSNRANELRTRGIEVGRAEHSAFIGTWRAKVKRHAF
jgi:hypothetical protein